MTEYNPFSIENLPPESAPIDTNPFSERNIQQEQDLRLNVGQAITKNPTQAADAYRIARETNTPVPAVANNLEEMQRQQLIDRYVESTKGAPVTQDLLKDPDKAAFVHDDIQNMTGIEKSLSYMSASGRAGLHDFAAATAKLLDTVQPFTTSDQDLAVLYKNDPEGLKRQREQGASAVLSRFARNQTQDANDIMSKVPQQVKDTYGNLEYQTLDPEKAAYLHPVKVVSDAIRSMPTTAALALTAFLTRGASMKAEQAAIAEGATSEVAKQAGVDAAVHMATRFGAASEGAVGYAQQYNSTQNQVEQTPFSVLEKSPEFQKMVGEGFDPNAARIFLSARTGEQAGVGAGVTDAITNAVGGHFLGKIIGEGGKLLPRMGKGFLTEGTQEFVQSGGEQLSENLALKNNINPEQDLSKGVVESMLQGLAVGGLTGGTFSGIAGRAQRDEEKIQGAGKFAEDVTALNELAKANNVLKMDYTTFEEFAQQAGENGNLTHVFMDANALMQSGVAEQVAAVSPSVAEQLPLAAESKGTISIPVGEYTAAIAPTEYAQALVPIIKKDPLGFSQNEAAEHVQNFQEDMVKEMQDVVDKGLVDDEFKQSTARLKEKFQTELDAVGHHTTDVNKAYATLLGEYFAVNAAKMGMSPEELHNQYALRFASELQQGYDQSGNLQSFIRSEELLDLSKSMGKSEWLARVQEQFPDQHDAAIRFLKKNKKAIDDVSLFARVKTQLIKRQEHFDKQQKEKGSPSYYFDFGEAKRALEDNGFELKDTSTGKPFNDVSSTSFYFKNETTGKTARLSDHPPAYARSTGYDLLIHPGSHPTYDALISQIKSATGNNGNFDPNDANIYHQSATDLLAVHNLSADNLAFADNLGGLAVPSIGVITSGKGGVDGFGEITLLGTKKLVDPKQERVFSSDAYTARFPSPEWSAVKVKPAQKIVNGIKAVADEFDDSSLVYETWDYLVNTPDANRVVDLWLRSSAIRALYLRSQGEDVAPVMRSVATRSSIPKESVASLQKMFEAVDQDKQIDVMMKTPEYQALVSAYAKKVKEYYKNKGRPELGEKLAESFTYRDFEGLGFDLKNLGREDVDRVDTRSMLAGKIDPQAVAFKQWVEDKVVPAFGDPYIKLGSKKAHYTLNNIVKQMTDSKVKGKEKTMTFNRGQVRATAAVEFSDIEQMREAAKDQINDPAEYKKAMEESEEKVQAYQNAITPFTKLTDWRGNPNIWDAMDGSMKALARWATSKNKSVATMRSALLKEDFDVSNISDEIIKQAMEAGQSILHAPVPYFEAKPQREVSLDEFAGAVIPSSATQETRDILNKHGIKYTEYQEGEERGVAVRSLAADLADQGLGTLFQGASTNRGSFNPTNLTISLLKNADLSTFLHETGHFFLEMQMDLAARLEQEAGLFGIENLKPGEQSIIKDANAILNWFGVQDLDTWHRMTLDEKRGFHEQFARGFEAYLFEGNAPSIELQPLFQRFKEWLKRVYKSIEALDVELTDEVRGVFDRMIASEEQIQLAEQARSMMPLFTTLDTAPMTADEFREYQNQQQEATATAVDELDARGLRDMQWLRNARGRVLKALQKDAKEKRREVRAEARTEVLSQPIYRAWSLLTAKINPEDKIPKPTVTKTDPNVVTPEIDSLFTAVAKLGGLNKADLMSQWDLDPAYKQYSGVFGKPVWRREGGLSVDAMLEALIPYGYLTLDEHGKPEDSREFEELFDRELRGDPQYSVEHDYTRDQEQRAGSHVTNPHALNAVRFDKGELISAGLSDGEIGKLQAYKMVAKSDGINQDIIADLILDENGNPEFTSGDDLIQQLLAATPPNERIEALTDLHMLEKYGDLSSPEAIEKAADKAIHNDVRARLAVTEANALARATGGKKILASAAKMLAATTVARKKIRDLIPSLYTNAEVKAAKSAEKYLRAKDLVNAGAEKRNQVFNMYAAKAAMDARDEIEKGLRYLKKFNGNIKGIDADYADQIAAILSRFDLRKLSNKEIDRRKSLAKWLTAQEEEGLVPDLPEHITNEAFIKPYKELSVEEFRGVIDSVKQIEHLGRLKKKLLLAKDQREFEAIRDEIAQSINDHSQGRVANTRTINTGVEQAKKKWGAFAWGHAKIATLAKVLDGGNVGGPVWEFLIRPANERGDWETTQRAEATIALSQILAPVFKLGKMGGKGLTFEGIGRSFNREARIAIALNVGNEGNLQRLLGGEGWSLEQIMPILKTLTREEWTAVQAVWDHFETYRPLIAAKERRVYGKEPNWVEPTPFTVALANGESVSLRGGYYPIKYDPAASQRAEEHSDAEAAKRQLQGAYTSATTRRSFTKARAEEVKGRPLLYSLSGVYSGVNDVIHDLAWHEWLIDTNRLIKNNAIDTAIRQHYGPEFKNQFKTWTSAIAEGEKGSDNPADIALSRIRQGVSVAGLGFNVMSAAMQPTGFTQSISVVGAKWVGLGVSRYLADIGGSTRNVNELSEFMANRARTRFRELNELRNSVEDQSPYKEWLGRYAYFLMMRCQQMVDVPTWIGAYEKAQAEGVTDDKAIALADQAVIDSQGSGMLKDLSSVERGGAAQKLFTVFYSYMNTALNIGIGKTMSAEIGKRKAKLAADYLLLYVLPPVLGLAIKDALTPTGDDDDDYWEKLPKRLASNQIDYLMGLMVIVREFSEAAKLMAGVEDHKQDYQGPAGVRMIADTVKFGEQLGQGEFDTPFRKAFVNLMGDAFALPSAQINRTVTGIEAIREGKTHNPSAIVFGYKEHR